MVQPTVSFFRKIKIWEGSEERKKLVYPPSDTSYPSRGNNLKIGGIIERGRGNGREGVIAIEQ